MPADKRHNWNPNFHRQSPLFTPLHHLADQLAAAHPAVWPDIRDYQQLLNMNATQPYTGNGAALQFVCQGEKPATFDQHYEPRIYLSGEVQTREQNWHDFFQVLVWNLFPATKIQLNALHYHSALKRKTATPPQANRSSLENAITLFDECGIIIAASDPSLLTLIRNHQWKELFWHRRAELKKKLHCIVFGHALYEKALQPYIGMTGNALLLDVDESFHALSAPLRIKKLDNSVATVFSAPKHPINTRMLTPFPLLGIPGWDPDNDNEVYYDNRDYFRPRRQHRLPA